MSQAIEKDFLQPQILSNPFAFYADAIVHNPVVKIPGMSIYAVFSYELVKQVIDRPEDFSSNFAEFVQGRQPDNAELQEILSQGWPFVDTLLTADPPVHTHFRKLVNMAFSAPRVNKISDRIRSTAVALLARGAAAGRCDFVKDFAAPFPVAVITDMIGLSAIPKDKIRLWSDAIADRFGGLMTSDRELQCAREVVEFQQAMMAEIHARRRETQGDFLSGLVEVQTAEGDSLTDVEILSILQQIIPAATDTTTVALTRGLLILLKHPDLLTELRTDSARIPAFIEEMLRIEAPGQSTFRITKRDTNLGGVDIPKGAQILVRVGAANRDPGMFADPEVFDIDRKNVRSHLSFGRGHHGCLGVMLARKELGIAFEEILANLKDIQIVEGSDLTFSPSIMTPTLQSLPLSFVWQGISGDPHEQH
jgi:cytochrome P450